MMEWFFDGLGTELVSLLAGSLIGGTAGYKIGFKKCSKQVQKAKDNARQIQNVAIKSPDGREESSKVISNFNQLQKAGDGAIQMQNGEIDND